MAQRLSIDNINFYVQVNYGDIQRRVWNKVFGLNEILQTDYEGDNDCTLTSITEITKFYSKTSKSEDMIYNDVKSIAKKYCYTDSFGTLTITINKIVNKVNELYNIKKKSKCAYIKGIGFNIKTLLELVTNETPLMLNMMNDGNGYYKNHTVTVVGVVDYVLSNQKHIYILEVHDNWSKKSSFIDYQKLSLISSINYCK